MRQTGSIQHHVLHIYGPQGRIAQVAIDADKNVEPLFVIHDDLGSVLFVTDKGGDLVEEFFYDPFGRRLLADTSEAALAAPASGVTRRVAQD